MCWNAFTPGETRDFGIDEGRRERERDACGVRRASERSIVSALAF